MDPVHGLQFHGVVVDLEEHALFGAKEDPVDLILEAVGLLVPKLEVEHRKGRITSMVVEHDRGTRKVAILDAPEFDVLMPTRHQAVVVDGAELDTQHITVGGLLGHQDGFTCCGNVLQTPHDDDLAIEFITTHRHQQLAVVTKRHANQILVGCGEGRQTLHLEVVPQPHDSILALLARHDLRAISRHIQTRDRL